MPKNNAWQQKCSTEKSGYTMTSHRGMKKGNKYVCKVIEKYTG
jgi:hypothetical protein